MTADVSDTEKLRSPHPFAGEVLFGHGLRCFAQFGPGRFGAGGAGGHLVGPGHSARLPRATDRPTCYASVLIWHSDIPPKTIIGHTDFTGIAGRLNQLKLLLKEF